VTRSHPACPFPAPPEHSPEFDSPSGLHYTRGFAAAVGVQQSVATEQAARVEAHPPRRLANDLSCICAGSVSGRPRTLCTLTLHAVPTQAWRLLDVLFEFAHAALGFTAEGEEEVLLEPSFFAWALAIAQAGETGGAVGDNFGLPHRDYTFTDAWRADARYAYGSSGFRS
jgi:hypothetical protein